jgi:hypothetical protein
MLATSRRSLLRACRPFACRHLSAADTTVSEKKVLFMWGTGDNGQLGHEVIKSGVTNSYVEILPKKVDDAPQDIIQLALGATHSAAVTKSGEVYTWGEGKDHKLGHGDTDDLHEPQKVRRSQRAAAVADRRRTARRRRRRRRRHLHRHWRCCRNRPRDSYLHSCAPSCHHPHPLSSPLR